MLFRSKVDGSACLVKDGELYKRYDRKLKSHFVKQLRSQENFVVTEDMFNEIPADAIPCQENPDPVTYHHPHWVKIDVNKPEDKFHIEALSNFKEKLSDGTYELIGSKINNNPYGLENNLYNGRQIKVLFFINLIERLIKNNRYDILNDMFKEIIKEKINNYIDNFIKNHAQGTIPTKITFNPTSDASQIPLDLNSLIDNLIDNNFKRDALKEKFIKDGLYKPVTGDTIDIKINELGDLTTSDGKPTQFKEKVPSSTNYKNYIIDAIKYDFYTTGFEGVYINENIIGLIKYLGKDGKLMPDGKMLYLIQSPSDRDMIDIPEQNKDNIIELGKKQANLIIISRTNDEKKLVKALTDKTHKGGIHPSRSTSGTTSPTPTDIFKSRTAEVDSCGALR